MDQIVLVTGAGRGLGSAIAEAFAREGAKVAINYHNSQAGAQVLAQRFATQTAIFQADIRDEDAVHAMFSDISKSLGTPTTIIHNALAPFQFNGDARSKLDRLTWEEMTAHLDTALHGALNVIKAASPSMIEAGFGRIVTIGTNLFQHPVVPYHDYIAAKAALLSLTRTAAAELGCHGITVNMVSGGLLRTTDASAATPEEIFDAIAANTPLRRVATPQELADTVLFFASPWARAVTGQNLIVDGGLVFN